MTKNIFVCLLFFILLSFTSINDIKILVLEKLNSYSENYPEKLYIKTDKPYYTLGEDLWFSAYLVNGINHKKSEKSNVIHVELINENDSIVSQRLLYTEDISVAGDFNINKTWQEGIYVLRAYTNYMRNQNSDYFFKKEIPIWKLNTKENSRISKLNDEFIESPDTLQNVFIPKLSFYPEGGYMVNGLPSKVGIKVTNQFNEGVEEIEGFIKDSEGNIVTAFKTLKFGLGFTEIKPKPNTNYHASIKINNQEVSFPLPKALNSGYNLNLTNNGEDINIIVSTNKSIGLKKSFLVAHQRGKVIFEKLETTNSKKYSLKLITSSLQDGIANFTLFDNQGKPVCERLIFIDNPNNNIKTKITNSKSIYNPNTNTSIYNNLLFNESGSEAIHNNLSNGWIESNPLFVNSSNSDFTLTESSPAIDAGSTQSIQTEDISGNLRNDGSPDIGAYEYSGVLSIVDLNEIDLKVYPNPTINDIYIITDRNIIMSFVISDITGKQILTKYSINKVTSKVSLNDLKSGLYLLKVNTTKGTKSYKIIKK